MLPWAARGSDETDEEGQVHYPRAGCAEASAGRQHVHHLRLPDLATSRGWARAVRRASGQWPRAIAAPNAAGTWGASVFKLCNKQVMHGFDHLVEDDGKPLAKASPRVRSSWSRAIARAGERPT